MLETDRGYSAGYSKIKFRQLYWELQELSCKTFREKTHMTFNFVNLSTGFCPRLQMKNNESNNR